MKTVITSMLVLMMAIAQAMPVEKDSVENGKKSKVTTPMTTPVSTSLVSVQQLQEENAALKARITEMENRLENENSMLQYKLIMQNVLTRMNETVKQDKMEDLQSQVGFTKMMSDILLMTRSMGIQ